MAIVGNSAMSSASVLNPSRYCPDSRPLNRNGVDLKLPQRMNASGRVELEYPSKTVRNVAKVLNVEKIKENKVVRLQMTQQKRRCDKRSTSIPWVGRAIRPTRLQKKCPRTLPK